MVWMTLRGVALFLVGVALIGMAFRGALPHPAHVDAALATGAGRWFARRAPAHRVLRPGT